MLTTCNITQDDYVSGVEEGFSLLIDVAEELKRKYLE